MCQCKDASTVWPSRRGFVAGLSASAILPPLAFPGAARARCAKPQNAVPPEAVFKRLSEGNARYVAGMPNETDFSAGRAARAAGQCPVAAVISCSDSRVAPELIFDQGPGDVFTVRLAGNIVTNAGLASVEFAIEELGAPLIVVLGHSGCGAVAAAIDVLREGVSLPGLLPELIAAIKPAVEMAKQDAGSDALLDAAIVENVRLGMQEVRDRSSIVDNAIASGRVGVVGGVYEISTGKVAVV